MTDKKSNPEIDGEARLLDHTYDGIQEYDNPLPGWWVAIFWLSILFAPIYIVYYHYGPGLLPEEAYARELAAHNEVMVSRMASLGEVDDEQLAQLQQDPEMVARGAMVFSANCVACHAVDGGGGIGPNLTDDNWLHGGSLSDIYQIVVEGVPEKGMVSWSSTLKPDELMTVSAYIGTLRGTTPADPRPPQGELYSGSEG